MDPEAFSYANLGDRWGSWLKYAGYDGLVIFAFREFGLPVSTVFFYNWDQMRTTGKFFAIADDGTIANMPAGAIITKLSMAFYPLDAQPI